MVFLFEHNIDFYKLCIQAFANSTEFQVILNLGKNIDIESLGELPDNCFAFKCSPNQILPITDIVITDSSMESINEIFYYNENLPLI